METSTSTEKIVFLKSSFKRKILWNSTANNIDYEYQMFPYGETANITINMEQKN